jgi:hypothetical protein
MTSRCGRCIRASSTPAGRKAQLVQHGDHPSEERHGFEIVWVPELSGWQVRAPGGLPSDESYRSIFLARKAADEMASVVAARELTSGD